MFISSLGKDVEHLSEVLFQLVNTGGNICDMSFQMIIERLTDPNSRPSAFMARYRLAQIPLITTSPTAVAWSCSRTAREHTYTNY